MIALSCQTLWNYRWFFLISRIWEFSELNIHRKLYAAVIHKVLNSICTFYLLCIKCKIWIIASCVLCTLPHRMFYRISSHAYQICDSHSVREKDAVHVRAKVNNQAYRVNSIKCFKPYATVSCEVCYSIHIISTLNNSAPAPGEKRKRNQ